MPFSPKYSEWVSARMTYVPKETASWCNKLSGLQILDVGCGDMIADIGLLSLGPKHITGMDVHVRDWNVIEHAASTIRKHGYTIPSGYASRLSYVAYDGCQFPFRNDCFDLVHAWGIFEHVANVHAVLSEARRVVKPDGRIFAVIYPWFHCFTGSHLTDYIDEPYFHLLRPDEWVFEKLKEFLAKNPKKAGEWRGHMGPGGCTLGRYLMEHMWPEYCKLNRFSARMFISAALEVGLTIERLQSTFEQQHLDRAPKTVDVADLITTGTTVVFRPAKQPKRPWYRKLRFGQHNIPAEKE